MVVKVLIFKGESKNNATIIFSKLTGGTTTAIRPGGNPPNYQPVVSYDKFSLESTF